MEKETDEKHCQGSSGPGYNLKHIPSVNKSDTLPVRWRLRRPIWFCVTVTDAECKTQAAGSQYSGSIARGEWQEAKLHQEK
jgi:hypothetical protein